MTPDTDNSHSEDSGDAELPPHLIEVARQMSRLGDAIIRRQLDPSTAARVSASLAGLIDEIEPIPMITKVENLGRRNRIDKFIETGTWPDPPPDGAQIEFDPSSPVGGELNPFSIGAKYYRDGDEAVGRVNVGRCFEGPPERVHGGIITAIFDEVMGCVFRATGTPSAFTGELAVRFTAPCPIGEDLVFRARQVSSSGRRRMLAGEASGPGGEFASATATFIEMRPDHFASPSVPSTK